MPEALDALREALDQAVRYRSTAAGRPCMPERDYHEMRREFSEPLPETGADGKDVIRQLAEKGDPGLMQMVHPRFFGWVLGGSHPAGVAADWLASAWGQNTGYHTPTPTTAAVEEVAAGWLLELLDLPREASVGFATGASIGNFVALAAARNRVLRAHGWNANADGLFGAPEIHVFIGDDAHTSVFSALQYLGLGHGRVVRIDTDCDGRMQPGHLSREVATRAGPMIVVAQAGQINTGAFDPFEDLVDIARGARAWLHVDGAFGLWARASVKLRSLTTGIENADSWVTDGHKWLQTPFDTGYAIVRDRDAHQRAMTTWASYLPTQQDDERSPSFLVPELSRRARGLATWAMLKTLGRRGVSDMVERHCQIAQRMAAKLSSEAGVRILNDVVLNQVIVEFGPADASTERRKALTQAVIDAALESGDLFVGGARWRDLWVMRVSVISSETTIEDGDAATETILAAWKRVRESALGP
ncbi:MAG: pyridoxal phosphate-dependent decarboxylase family protein [Methyloligellaceae bacterium]